MTTAVKPVRLITQETAFNILVWKDAPIEVTIEQLSEPAMWAHVSKGLTPGTHIIVQPAGLPWEAEFIVQSAGVGFAKVKLARHTMINGEHAGTVVDGAKTYVKWNGPANKYTVFRSSDDVALEKGFADREAAEEWAKRHVLALAA